MYRESYDAVSWVYGGDDMTRMLWWLPGEREACSSDSLRLVSAGSVLYTLGG